MGRKKKVAVQETPVFSTVPVHELDINTPVQRTASPKIDKNQLATYLQNIYNRGYMDAQRCVAPKTISIDANGGVIFGE